MDRFEFAVILVREAGDVALSYFNRRAELPVATKGAQDFASEADLQTEVLIKQRLSEAFPQDAFLGEETGATEYSPEQGIWVVDPIDGTQPFISGLTSWCVSIAFVRGGKLLFGTVYAPARNELFAGGIGFPATLNGKPVARPQAKSIRSGLTGTGYSPKSAVGDFLPAFTRFLEAGGMFYRDGSGALGLCYVADGRLVGFFEPAIKSWDCLGAIAVIHAAGLKTSNFLGGDGLFKGNPIVAGSDSVCEELRSVIGSDYGDLR